MSELNLMDTYELRETLGTGGGGTVIKAYHKRLQKDVVIKKIHADIQDENDKRIEADILKNLHHQYLPQVFDYFVVEGTGYTVMDYVQGESFGQKLARGEKFSEKKVLKYARQICEALNYLHSQKLPVIHGDIKPDNIMLTPDDNVCLIDFNISGITKEGHALTFGYTEGYGAPEQYREFQRISAMMESHAYDNMAGAGRTEKLNRPAEGAGRTEKLDRSTDAALESGESEPLAGRGMTEKLGTHAVEEGTKKLAFGDSGSAEALEDSMEPEQPARQSKPELTEGIPIDKRSDIYSLGATLYHIYSGQMLSRDARNDLSSRTSEGFLYLLNKALQENPDDRYQDAGQMLAAINRLYKHDRRYRNMIIRHAIAYVLLTCALLGGVYLVLYGKDVYRDESLLKYDNYVESLADARTKENETGFEMLYGEATAFMPDRLEAYYQKALFLFETGQYQEAVNFVRKTLDGNSTFYSQSGVGDMYYIMGNAYFELMNYESASNAFANAIKQNGDNPTYFVDQAIALARIGSINEAKEVLGTAEAKGALSDTIYLVSGEIKLAEEDYTGAEDDFRLSIAEAEDDYTCMRAYVMCSKAILGQGASLEAVEEGINLLNEALDRLPNEHHAIILEQLASMYIEGYEVTQDLQYAQGVLDTLKKIANAGWATFTTYDNMVNIYYRIGDYAAEGQLLEELAGKYPDNYKVPMKQAFLEVTLQSEKPQTERDYSGFVAYYENAQKIYSTVKKNGWSDSEMQVLENAYQELVDGHWIE